MKTLFKKSLLVLMVAFIAVFTLGVSSKVKAEGNTATVDFKTNFSTYAKNWSGYASKTLSNSDLGCSENLNVTFSRVSKQTQTITNMPVVAVNNKTEYVTIEVTDKKIESVTFVLNQWTTKTFNSIKIEYFNGSSWVSGSDSITKPAKLQSNTFEGDVVKVRLSITTTATKNTQVGVSAINLVFKAEEVESDEIKNIKAELNSIESFMKLGYTYTTTPTPKNFTSEKVVFSEKGYENAQTISSCYADSFIVSFSGNTNEQNVPLYYETGSSVRCYSGNNFTVSSECTISEIKFTYGADEKNNSISVDTGTFNEDTWTGEATSVTFTIDGSSGHRRIASIQVTFAKEETIYVNEYSAVEFRISYAVNAAIADIEGIDSYGVCVSTSEKARTYDSLENADDKYYKIISIGDALNNIKYAKTEFTVKAYVIVDGNTYYSELEKSYSILSMIQEYKSKPEYTEYKSQIDSLVDVFTKLGCNVE